MGRIATGKEGLLLFLVIGLIAGWLASRIMRTGPYGLQGDLIAGVVGAFIGGWLFVLFGIAVGGPIGSLIRALIAAIGGVQRWGGLAA